MRFIRSPKAGELPGTVGPVTKDMIDTTAKIADVTIPDEYKDAMLNSLNGAVQGYEAIYKLHMDNSVQPALVFDPLPMGWKISTAKAPMKIYPAPASPPRRRKILKTSRSTPSASSRN